MFVPGYQLDEVARLDADPALLVVEMRVAVY
jgi:hypothetical protein